MAKLNPCNCLKPIAQPDAREFNWNPECEEHGVESEWFNLKDQAERRQIQFDRMKDLQRQAREARRNYEAGN